ncbi:hypothetical protein I3760_Q013600 [Carya illinoinensis]|nr:hypothetical protein I3760_Q017400 [Carya illinoinensis]KAG2411298.1 hypothetical protein I3760_Q013600 [Carya illinoinensis]
MSPTISFGNEGCRGVVYPHDDALVVTMLVANYTIRRILIDNKSLVDIPFWEAFNKMGISAGQLRPAPTTLKGFTGDAIQPIGSIALPVSMGTDTHVTTNMTNFLVFKTRSAYNAIIGLPTLNTLNVIPSTRHLKMKFPTRIGVGEVCGEHILARECYVQELKQGEREVSVVESGKVADMAFSPPSQVLMTKVETRNEDALKHGEVDEPLELVTFDYVHPEGYVKIGTKLTKEDRQQLISLLLEHKDMFAWSHKDMPEIGEEVIKHSLSVDPKVHLIK